MKDLCAFAIFRIQWQQEPRLYENPVQGKDLGNL